MYLYFGWRFFERNPFAVVPVILVISLSGICAFICKANRCSSLGARQGELLFLPSLYELFRNLRNPWQQSRREIILFWLKVGNYNIPTALKIFWMKYLPKDRNRNCSFHFFKKTITLSVASGERSISRFTWLPSQRSQAESKFPTNSRAWFPLSRWNTDIHEW